MYEKVAWWQVDGRVEASTIPLRNEFRETYR